MPSIPITFKCRGQTVGSVHIRPGYGDGVRNEVAFLAGWQARVRQALVVAENEHGDRVAVGDPTTESFWV